MNLAGTVAIVTGGGQGIGLATAGLLAREGARVAVAERNPEYGRAAVESIRAAGHDAVSIPTDVSRSEDVAAMIASTLKAYGGVDILVNNAGVDVKAPLLETTEDQWDYVLGTNLKGSFLCAKAAVPHMLRRGGGAIVNVASVLALRSSPGFGVYCASKAGILGLTRSMVLEWSPLGIRVNCVLPGAVDTSLMWRYTATADLASAHEIAARRNPLGRIATPDEIAEGIVWLCSPQASYAAGAFLEIDGGIGSASYTPESFGPPADMSQTRRGSSKKQVRPTA